MANPKAPQAGPAPAGGGRSGAASGAPRLETLNVGRLLAHGHAPYQFRRGETPSYFVRLLTDRGERHLWGKDLARAIATAATHPRLGDLVGARRVGREAVTVLSRERDGEGRVVAQSEQRAHRNRWVLEKVQFFAERATLARRLREGQLDASQSVRKHPELASTFLTLRGAEQIAERRIADPADRVKFVALVREAMAASIQNGEPLPTVRLKSPAPDRTQASREPLPSRDGRTR